MSKVLVCGWRGFRDYDFFERKLDYLLQNITQPIEIVHGGQVSVDPITKEKYGADYYADVYGKKRGYKIHEFPANWGRFGLSAGGIRNREMGDFVAKAISNGENGYCVPFLSRHSKGTKNMIKEAALRLIPTRVVKID